MTAGQRAPASHSTNTLVLSSANPPRRGFRKPADLRFLNRLRGRARHPPPHNARHAAQFSRTVRAKPERLEIVAAYGGRAWLPGSGCALSPFAYAVLLNKPSTCSVAVVPCALRCLSEQAFCSFSRHYPALVRQISPQFCPTGSALPWQISFAASSSSAGAPAVELVFAKRKSAPGDPGLPNRVRKFGVGYVG